MKLYDIVFSPTGGTQKVSDSLTGALEGEVSTVDLSDSRQDFNAVTLTQEDVAFLCVPSYGGRVPAVAAERLCQVHGNGARAVLVCVYGNRAYEDTLAELEDTAKQAGFRVVAAVAAIAEHSHRPSVCRRPARCPGQPRSWPSLPSRFSANWLRGMIRSPAIPGSRPYKKAGKSGMVPKASKDCVSCGLCAASCPVQAIDKDNPKRVDETACICCMRCVAVCPHSARALNAVALSAVSLMLKKVCSERKDCELFL